MTRVAIKIKKSTITRQPRLRIFMCVNQDCDYSCASTKTANIRVRQPRLRIFVCVNQDQTYQDVIVPTLSRRHCSNLIKTSLLQPHQDVAPTLSRRHCSNLIKTSLLQPYQDCDSGRLDEVVSGDEICVCLNESVRKPQTKAWEDSALIATPRHLSPETRRAKKKPHWQIAQGHTTTHLLTGRRFHSKSALGTAIYQCLSSIQNIEYRVQNLDCL